MKNIYSPIRNSKGQSLVETALVLPLLLLIVFGTIEFGRVFNAYLVVSNASREGARAAAVGNYLRTAGIETNNITEDGKGYSEPIADNTSEAGRAKNRRVEIFITNDEY